MSRPKAMPKPMPKQAGLRELTLVTIYGEYLDVEKRPYTGTIEFTPTAWLADQQDAVILPMVPTVVKLNDQGRFSADIVSTASPGVNPEKWVYKITETINGYTRVFYAEVKESCSMADLVPLVPPQEWETTRGPRGYSVLHGDRDPTPLDGIDGDFWVNQVTHYFWAAKENGQWGDNWFIGGAGTPGPPGPKGDPGAVEVFAQADQPTAKGKGAIWLVTT